ncbi:dihydrofolate reductase family protein [Deinococcus ficus]|uniref:Pyrimidine reductase n=1 Tax=Deinococcus ficus TaxID=317577 RepID=A0A221SVV4_9DEIO|nr:dihydrofolate reductase family protein [Deinococcus ficus]ASN80777.1 pyrimidine reductase [Deinococcus ficus]
MRKLIVTEFLSLDGVMEEPGAWTRQYSPEDRSFKREELFETDALVLGRVTFEDFLGYWPGQEGKGEFADRMNSLPKHVTSRTLVPGTLGWNAEVLPGNLEEAVSQLKGQGEGSLLVYGSATLAQWLLRHGLVDELRLMVFPVVLGRGKRLFGEGDRVPLKLAASRDLGDGVLLLTYEPDSTR